MFKETKRLAAMDTLIGQGTIAEGKLICEASLRIEGEYRGDIECKGDVIIGECGIARSNITARDITLAGKLYGDIVVKEQLVITSSGQLIGNITAPSLVIHSGGKLNGSCFMEMPVEPAQPAQASQAAETKQRAIADAGHGHTKADEAKVKSRQAG